MNESADWRAEGRRRLVQMLHRRPASAVCYNLRDACVEWSAFDYDFEFHVTIQNNEPLDEHQQMDVARRFGALVNSLCLGKRWQRWPAAERAFFAGATEAGATINCHQHLLLRMPREFWKRFEQQTAREPWKRAEIERWLSLRFTERGRAKFICPHGDIRFRALRNEADRLIAADYVFKEFRPGSNLILSTQFDPATKGNYAVTAKRPA